MHAFTLCDISHLQQEREASGTSSSIMNGHHGRQMRVAGRQRETRMTNWRGIPYFIALSVLGSQEWKPHFRDVERSDIGELSDRYLQQLLRHACEQVPYYRSLGLEGRPLSDYPLRKKEDLRKDPDQYTTDSIAQYQ